MIPAFFCAFVLLRGIKKGDAGFDIAFSNSDQLMLPDQASAIWASSLLLIAGLGTAPTI